MDEHQLSYEEPTTKSMFDTVWTCEHDGCDQEATTRWMCRDEDGDVYATDKCDDHPETDPEWGANELRSRKK